MALRCEVPFNARRVSGTAVPGSLLYIYLRGTTTQVTVYQDETSATTLTQPLIADSSGEFAGWVDPDQLDVKLTMDSVDKTVPWDATPGGGVVGQSEPTLKVIRGIVATGTSPSIVEGTGFTVSAGATGQAQVNFTVPFSDLPAMVGNGVTLAPRMVMIYNASANNGTITVRDAAGALVNDNVHFIAIGPA